MRMLGHRDLPARNDLVGNDLARTLATFQSDTQEIEAEPDPMLARSLVWLLAAAIAAFVIWASFSTLDRVVTARGALQPTLPSILVQPLENAVVRSLDAEVGEVVKAGQVLMTLDATFVQADLDQLRPRLDALDAEIARLEAEGADEPYRPADAKSAAAAVQLTLWRERKTDREARLASFDEKIHGAEAALRGIANERQALQQRSDVLGQIEGIRKELLANNNGSKLNALQAADAKLDVTQRLAQVASAGVETQHKLDSLRADREAFLSDWRAKAAADLVTTRAQRDGIQEQLSKAKRKGELVSLQAPADAVVLERADRAIGSVVKSAESVYTLLPLNAPLEADIRIAGRDIGFVKVGDPVKIKFDAYHYLEHGVVEGEIRTISEDAFSDRRDDPGVEHEHYRARVRITAVTLRDVPTSFRLMPGLPLSADIKVGERTVMSYLLRPLMRGFGEAMREP